MSRFDFARPGGLWGPEMAPGAQDYQRWDVTQSKAINGTSGLWTPTGPVNIGGAGLQTAAGIASGGVRTRTFGRLLVGFGDEPTYTPSRLRTITVPLHGNTFAPADDSSPTVLANVFDDANGYGVKIASGAGDLQIEIPGRYMYVGARIASISLNFVVTTKPQVLPTTAMQMALVGSPNTATNTNFTNPSLEGNIQVWSSGSTISLGQYWIPPYTNGTAYYYKVTNAGSGTIGAAQPTWPLTVGTATTPDSHGVVWTCTGLVGIAYAVASATTQSYWSNGQPQSLVFTSDGTGSGFFSNVILQTLRYSLQVSNTDPSVLFTSLDIDFDSIGSMAFA